MAVTAAVPDGVMGKQFNSSTTPQISHPRREKTLRVLDGNQNLFPVMFNWHHLTRCDELLDWCLVNRITGNSLSDFIKLNGGILKTAGFILMKIDREKQTRPIIVGKDYLA